MDEKDAVINQPDARALAEANRVYFQVLGATRASLTKVGTIAFVVIFLLGLDTFVGLNALIFWEGADEYVGLFVAHVIALALCAIVLALSLIRGLLYRFQAFFSGVIAVLAALLVYSLCMMSVALSSLDPAREGQGLSPAIFGTVAVIALVFVAAATGVHVLLLRRRLRVGHSEKRTLGNFVAVSGSNRATIAWITLALLAVVPNVLTRGQYLINTLGVLTLILFACVTTSLPVEFAYLAYLKSRDRDYWEVRPRGMPKAERRRLTRKVILWGVGIVVAVVLFWVFAKYGHS